MTLIFLVVMEVFVIRLEVSVSFIFLISVVHLVYFYVHKYKCMYIFWNLVAAKEVVDLSKRLTHRPIKYIKKYFGFLVVHLIIELRMFVDFCLGIIFKEVLRFYIKFNRIINKVMAIKEHQ
jgi:hypothetical protein